MSDLFKFNNGALSLTNDHTYTGDTHVLAGDSIDTFIINGDFFHKDNFSYKVDLSLDLSADQLNVLRDATIDDHTNISVNTNNQIVPGQYFILTTANSSGMLNGQYEIIKEKYLLLQYTLKKVYGRCRTLRICRHVV